jgi:kynureninase
MDGNSLGRLPKQTITRLSEVIQEEWGRQLIRSWGAGWVDAPIRIGEKIAQLVGAAPGQVVVCDSTTVNLYKLSMAALMLRPERTKIITDSLNFPTDLYVLQGCNRILGGTYKVEMLPVAPDGITIDTQTVLRAVDKNTALVSLSHVHFKSGFLYNAEEITRYCHQKGALVLWDLSHSAGAVPVDLDGWDADFAAGCSYKYLNGGPGAPAYLYVNKRLHQQVSSPIWGWFGDRSPFTFQLEYRPSENIKQFLAGTPSILSLAAIEPGVDLLLEAGIERIRKKSIALTGYMIALFDALLAPLGFVLGTPRDPECRGSHVSIRHPEGYRINRALIEEMQVVPDFREPDNIRFGLAPVYTSYQDVWQAVDRLRRLMIEERYKNYSNERLAVT